MGFIDTYPMTNFHELNADYLLKRMHEVEEHVKGLDGYIEGVVAQDMIPYINQLNDLIAKYNVMESTLNNLISQVDAEMAAQFTAIKNNLALELARGLQRFTDLFAIQNERVNTAIAEQSRVINRELNVLQERFKLFDAEMKLALKKFLDDLPESFVVTSPYSGQVVSIQTAINELYDNVSRYRAITAGEFDALGLTAEEFDDLELTAWDFDIYGLDYLPVSDPLHHMFSPFTGVWSTLQDVIDEIVNFEFRDHALTAKEFDDLELTAGELDAEPFTAYDFDFIGKDILAA